MIWKLLLILLMCSTPSYAWVLEWEHDGIDTDGYRVYCDNRLVRDVPYPNLTVSLDGCPRGEYFVTAYNERESGKSNSVLYAQYFYNSIRYEYGSTGMILYKGEHSDNDASVDDVNWIISKYYYAGGVVQSLIQIRIRTTSWTNRAVGW